jgi:N6-adenosine-specific RNA methylase IME4
MNLRIDLISDSPSFLFLWVGSGDGLDHGRALLKQWGFRRCEDIVWIKTNKKSHTKDNNLDENDDTLLNRCKEHCLVGIKGTVRRGQDSHFIHANIDADVIVAEESEHYREKPEEIYKIIERFCLGRKRLEIFGSD